MHLIDNTSVIFCKFSSNFTVRLYILVMTTLHKLIPRIIKRCVIAISSISFKRVGFIVPPVYFRIMKILWLGAPFSPSKGRMEDTLSKRRSSSRLTSPHDINLKKNHRLSNFSPSTTAPVRSVSHGNGGQKK